MLSSSIEETILFGKQFAERLQPGDVVCLDGDLGAGKTHFVKGIASFFVVDPTEVSSPTFTLINEYHGSVSLYHFDCYRIKNEQEALEIGTEDYLYGDGISVVEWPEKIRNLLPPKSVWVNISHKGEHEREILIESD
jgi:tRNA threonylcarbamoyladenosine biosynthesis protein TsaE